MMDLVWFDREEMLHLLSRRVEGFLAGFRQNVALIGPKEIGKTTLLSRLLKERLGAFRDLFPVIVPVQGNESLLEWAVSFVDALFYAFLQARGIRTLPSAHPELIEACAPIVPRTAALAKRILSTLEQAKAEEVYDTVWDLPDSMAQEGHLACLIVLEEFHRLGELGVKDPFHRLGRKIMVQGATMYIVTSSHPPLAHSILKEGLSLLFGKFEVIEMGPLDPVACPKILKQAWPFENANPFLESLLLELAQGYPRYLDLLLEGLRRPKRAGLSLEPEGVLLDLLEAEFLDPERSLRHSFEEGMKRLLSHRNRHIWMGVLLAIAKGNHRTSKLASALDRSASQILQAVSELERADLITRQGVFAFIPDRLFRLWLVTAFPLLRGIGLADAPQARAYFRQTALDWMTRIRESFQSPMEEQVKALLSLFGGEWAQIEGHRTFLPRWEKVERLSLVSEGGNPPSPSPGAGEGRPLLTTHRGGNRGQGWVVVPWNGVLKEAHARQLVRQLQDRELKPFRKLILGAYPVEINARLVLQASRIRLWDLKALNDLLNLYGLFPIPFSELEGPMNTEAVSFVEQAS